MKSMWAGVCFLALGFAGAVSAEILIKPNDANINYYGRFDFSNSASTVPFNWPGAIIEARFSGPSIGVELTDGGGYFNVEIDGVKQDSLAPTSTTHRTLKTNLSTDIHTIRITLRANGVNCAFGGFYLADGNSLVAPPTKPTRKIEYIGDSWTAGDVIGQTSTPIDQKYFNAPLTYARRTTEAFHAQDIIAARGGVGLVKSQGGAAVISTRYPKTLCDGTTNWNFASWIPDLVVLSLGINDSTIGGVTDTAFRAAYRALITTVRGNYPNVPLILMGISGTNLRNVNVVATFFPGITMFSSPITLANAKALYSHPNKAQHQQIADSLVPVVMQVMGWDTASVTGIRAHVAGRNARDDGVAILKTSMDVLVFPPEFSGLAKELIVYDYSGRELRRFSTEKQTFLLSEDAKLSLGTYFIRTKIAEKNKYRN